MTTDTVSPVPVYTVTLDPSNESEQQTKTILPESSGSINIVPPYKPQAEGLVELAAPAAPAKLTYRGGHLLSAVEIVTTFWGGMRGSRNPRAIYFKV